MDRGQRVRSEREAFRGEQRRGKVVTDGANALERLQVEVAELLLREILGRRVDRREVARLGLAVEVVRGDREAELVRAAADPDRGARDELPLEPRLVEPRRLDLARLVGDARGEDLQPPAATARHRADHALEHRLLVTEEIADPLRGHGLFVAPRTLPEQISDRGEPEPREATGQRRADAVQRLHRRAEKLRPRRGPRSAATARARRARRTR